MPNRDECVESAHRFHHPMPEDASNAHIGQLFGTILGKAVQGERVLLVPQVRAKFFYHALFDTSGSLTILFYQEGELGGMGVPLCFPEVGRAQHFLVTQC